MCRRQAPRPPAPPRTGTRICASSGRQEPVGRADDESCEPEDPGDEACRGSEGPLKRAIRRADTAQGARAGPDREGREDAERETEKTQDERARCGAISHRALAPSGSLPERTVAQKKVTMIHRTFFNPLISARPTMLMTHRTQAIGCRKIASRISTRSFITA